MAELSGKSRAASVPVLRGAATWRIYLHYLRDPVGCLCQANRRFGELCVLGSPFWVVGPKRVCVLASGPLYNKLVLGDPEVFRTGGQGIPGPRGSMQRRLRFGLTRMQEPKHRQQRQLVMPALLKGAVDSYIPCMGSIISDVIDRWRPGATVDMDHEMRWLTMRVAGETLFGERDSNRSRVFGLMVSEWLSRSYTFGSTYFPVNLPGTSYHALLKHAERLAESIRDMIQRRRADGVDGKDILSILIRARDQGNAGVTDDDLLGQTTILFAASFETTATALGWTLFLLAQHPPVALDLLDELSSAGGVDIDRLPLLEAVIKEAMRILPPVPLTLRAVTRTVEFMGLTLKKGDRVICSHYLTHRIPDLYPNPNRFDPQRWFTINPGPYEYIPFSAGPRQCIGYTFAMTVMKLALAAIMRRFRFTVAPGSKIDRSVRVTMSSRYGLPMTIHLQDRKFRAAPVRGNIHEMVDLQD